MFGNNNVMNPYNIPGNELRVVNGSPFLTIQGEGPYAGHAAIFIRLHGCNLRCTFCDTEFDNEEDETVEVVELANKCKAIQPQPHIVVITGGEPMLQNILPLCKVLRYHGYKIQIETAGTIWIEHINEYAQIICSPKTPVINRQIHKHAIAFKYVVSVGNSVVDSYIPHTATQPGGKAKFLAPPRVGAPVYLSPMDLGNDELNQRNRELVARLAIQHNVIAGLQMHKFMGVD